MEFDIVRTWKYRQNCQSLGKRYFAQIPAKPVGDSAHAMEQVHDGVQAASMVRCQFTGGYQSQCPTFGDPNGSCETSHCAPGMFSGPNVAPTFALQRSTTIKICL
jgi:hypothetical protein